MANDFDISIIIPAYKSRDYIIECLESVDAQRNIPRVQCIIVDDCGNDGTKELTRAFVASHADSEVRFSHIELPCNKGVSIAKNTGIDAATGEYLYFLDSDDRILPGCLEDLWSEVRKHPGVDMVSAGIQAKGWGDLQTQDYDVTGAPEILWTDDRAEINYMLLTKRKTSKIVTNTLFRRALLSEHSIRFAEGFIHEDDLLNFELSKYVSSFAIVPHDTYFYRYHGGSIMTSVTNATWMPRLTDWMSERCGGDFCRNEVRYLFRFIFRLISDSTTGLKVKQFRRSLKNLAAKATTAKERAGILILLYSPLPSCMRHIHGLRLPKKLVGPVRRISR